MTEHRLSARIHYAPCPADSSRTLLALHFYLPTYLPSYVHTAAGSNVQPVKLSKREATA